MTDAWTRAANETAGSGAGGSFLKLNDGESAVLAILGEPMPYLAKPFDRPGALPSKKVLLNVFVAKDKSLAVLDMAGATYQSLLEVRAKFPLNDWLLSYKRNGQGTKTRYVWLPEKQLLPAQKAHLESLQLADLREVADRVSFKDASSQSVNARSSYSRPQQGLPPSAPAAAPPPIADSDLPF